MEKTKIKKAMVLGSEGQIGKPLCNFLSNKKIKTYNIDLLLNHNHDLRKECDLLHYWMKDVDVVFFLAYDIGGSKFLKTKQGDYNFLQNNIKIMSNVFNALKMYNKPFIFASSVMSEMPWSSYGTLKRIGEQYTKSLGGITARFWNVYGPEHDKEKSHVITDFITKAKKTKTINMLSDGTEVRQFLYAEDCSKAMFSIAENYNKAVKYNKFDISNFVWTDINTVAKIIAEHYDAKIIYSKTKDTVQFNTKIEPKRYPIEIFWNPNEAIDIKTGIHRMINYYEKHQ